MRHAKLLILAGILTSTEILIAQSELPEAAATRIVVTAEGRHGKAAPVITREDVQVYHGNDRLQVADWIPCTGSNAGVQLFILIDDSASTSLGSQLDDIRAFINAQPSGTEIAVGYMRNGTADVVANFTSDHARAAKSLRLPLGSIGASASPYFSLDDTIKRWPAGSERREVLLITDGIDRFGGNGPANPYVDAAIEHAQRAGIVVFAVYVTGVGHDGHSFWSITWGQNYLSELAEKTGGEAWMLGFQTPVSLSPYLDDLTHRLSQQYLLSFFPKPEKKAGLQRIRLRTELQNVDLAGQESVYAGAGK
jgi:hypothetical protein